MTKAEAIDVLLEHCEEWRFEDDGREDNYCPECGWSKRRDGKPQGDWGQVFLDHHPGCKLKEAFELLQEEALPPTRVFVEGKGFLSRAELTELTVVPKDDRVVLKIGVPYEVLMTAAEAEVLAHVILTASKAVT